MLLKVGGIAAAVIVVLVIGLFAGIYFGFIPNPFLKPPEHSARYYPQDTLAYAWVTLYPGGNQRGQLRDLWERFNESRAFRNRLDDLFDSVEDETGLDLEQDVFPWAGPDFSMGVIELTDGDTPMLAATVGVRDRDAAAVFVDQWLDYLEDTEGADFDADTYRDSGIWVDESAGQAYALTQDLLIAVAASDETEDILEEMLDLADGEGRGSLAETPDFQAARNALPNRRFASVYVNSRAALDSIADYSADFADLFPLGGWDKAPDWVAGSARWVERGIVLEAVWPDMGDYGDGSGLSNPAALLPDTNLAFVAIADDYEMDDWRELWAEANVGSLAPELNELLNVTVIDSQEQLEAEDDFSEVLDLALQTIHNATGIDPETDFFDYIGGWTILAVDEFDFDLTGQDLADHPIDAVLMFQHHPDREQDLTDTMDKAAGLLEEHIGLDTDPANVGAGNRARIIDLDTLGVGYTPGYVLHDGYLTIGTTENSLETVVGVQEGKVNRLDSMTEYQRAVAHLPGERIWLTWANLHSIVAQLDAADMDLTPREYRTLRDSLGTLAVSGYDDGSYLRFNSVLTLFPE